MNDFINVIKKKYDIIILFLAIFFAVIFRFLCKNFESGDFIGCLYEWVKFYRDNGGFYALKDFKGDYNVLYQYVLIIISYLDVNCLYLIKLVSVFFDFVLAYGCAKCLDAFGVDIQKQRLCFAIIILMPTVLLNSAFWGQCDSIYVAFIIWGIYFLKRKKTSVSISFLAVAFALKLQTVFIMPVYFVAFLKKDIRLREFIAFPAIIVMTYLPAMFFGKPITDILNVYATQITEYPLMVMNAPTIFSLLGIYEYNSFLEKAFIAAAAVYVLIVVSAGFKNKHNNLLKISLLFVIGIPFLLPHMHERYFYLATIFALLCVFVYGKKYISVMLCVEASSLICYMHYFDFINEYCGNILSYLCSSHVSAMLMLLALVFTLLAVFSKADLKRYITCMVLLIPVILSLFLIFAQAHEFVWINDKIINFSVAEVYVDEYGNVMIPIRNFVKAVGGELSFDDETQRIVILYNDLNVSFALNHGVAQVNDKQVAIDKVLIRNGYTYISHKDISEMLGINYTVSGNKLFFRTN